MTDGESVRHRDGRFLLVLSVLAVLGLQRRLGRGSHLEHG